MKEFYKANKQKRGFPPMLLRTLAASMLGNVLAKNRGIRADEGKTGPGESF